MIFEKLTIADVDTLIKKDLNNVDLIVDESLEFIQTQDSAVKAYLGVYSDIDEQKQIARGVKVQTGSELAGVTCALKDNIFYGGQECSAASKMLEGYMATYDSFVVERLKDVGVIIMGRTNMDEFAMGASTEHSAFGPTHNPLDLTRVPGGTSGGSAAAVAQGSVVFALGTDTAGSIRQPASFCGVVGMKGTYGSVSRRGAIAMGSSLDQIGPITKNVSDCEKVFNVISGHDVLDGTCRDEEFRAKHRKEGEPKKIGVPRSFLETDGVSDDVKKNFWESIEKLKNQGYEIVDVDLPSIHHALPVYYIICPAEVSTNLARYDGIRYGRHIHGGNLKETYMQSRSGFGAEARRRIVLGTYVLSEGYYDAYYGKATRLRDMITAEMVEVFKEVDLIATPTTPTEAFKIGEKSDPVSMYLADLFTVPANITGVPAISVPSGLGAKGMPLGLQLMAPHFNENFLFQVGKDFEGQR